MVMDKVNENLSKIINLVKQNRSYFSDINLAGLATLCLENNVFAVEEMLKNYGDCIPSSLFNHIMKLLNKAKNEISST